MLAVFVFCSIGKAQTTRDEVMTKIEHALTQTHQSWQCLAVHTPQGEPGPESPKGTKYQFGCQQGNLAVQVFIFYGETSVDAEKTLANSQRLEVNVSKEVEGIGEKGYELVQDRYAWITFRKANVYCQVNVGIQNPSKTGGPFADKSDSREVVRDAARRFARLVVNQIPAT
jgi:hypothetical protein